MRAEKGEGQMGTDETSGRNPHDMLGATADRSVGDTGILGRLKAVGSAMARRVDIWMHTVIAVCGLSATAALYYATVA